MSGSDYSDDDYIEEGAEYSPKSEYSKPAICFEASQKCINNRAKEMKRGYFNTTITKEGLPIRSWVEDSRKVFISSVTALRHLLMPEILEDKKARDKIKIIDEKIKKLFDNYSYSPYTLVHGKYKKSKRKFMPTIDSIVQVIRILPDGHRQLVEVPGHWNKYVDAYWDKLVLLNDKLFSELIRIIHRLNYFKQKMRWG